MTHAIMLKATGGIENLIWQEVDVPAPQANEATIRHTVVGVNFIDIYHRTGLYPLPSYPHGIGYEAAGVVEAVGSEVSHLKVGDRVAYFQGPAGAYAEKKNQIASRLVKLPDAITDEQAAVLMLKGMTVWYLLTRVYPVKKGSTILLHAAAGGIGSLLTPWAKALGARVIGTAGSEAKADIAMAHGCDAVIQYKKEPIAARVRELTAGEGVDVAYDSVGKDTFFASLDSLKRRGLMVSFGNASGPLPPIDAIELTSRGSLGFIRPSLTDYIFTDEEYHAAANEVMARVSSGAMPITIGQRYALKDAGQAQRDLESGKTTGASVLLVS